MALTAYSTEHTSNVVLHGLNDCWCASASRHRRQASRYTVQYCCLVLPSTSSHVMKSTYWSAQLFSSFLIGVVRGYVASGKACLEAIVIVVFTVQYDNFLLLCLPVSSSVVVFHNIVFYLASRLSLSSASWFASLLFSSRSCPVYIEIDRVTYRYISIERKRERARARTRTSRQKTICKIYHHPFTTIQCVIFVFRPTSSRSYTLYSTKTARCVWFSPQVHEPTGFHSWETAHSRA
jgi:hypothetical protein